VHFIVSLLLFLVVSFSCQNVPKKKKKTRTCVRKGARAPARA
jgi:hypothetical protein